MPEILKYKLSKDKKGLLGYYHGQDGLGFYHIHSDELSDLEIWIRDLLLNKDK